MEEGCGAWGFPLFGLVSFSFFFFHSLNSWVVGFARFSLLCRSFLFT